MNLLYNHAGRLRSGWRLAIFLLALMMFAFVAFSVVALVAASVSPDVKANVRLALNGTAGFIVQGVLMLIVALVVGWLCARVLEDLPFRSLGASFHHGWLKDFAFGSIVGAVTLLLAALIITATGGFVFRVNSSAASAALMSSLIISTVVFVFGAAAEEALFRGYMLQTLTRSLPVWLALIPGSLLFAYVHLDNPAVAPIWTFLNTAIAGVWLAIAYARTRSLWFPFGVHWAWNFTMASVLGIPVSGITSIAREPFLRASETGADWLTGGSYGIEGGAVCTLVLILSSIFIWWTKWLKADEELLMMTSRENATGEFENLDLENRTVARNDSFSD